MGGRGWVLGLPLRQVDFSAMPSDLAALLCVLTLVLSLTAENYEKIKMVFCQEFMSGACSANAESKSALQGKARWASRQKCRRVCIK
jgi:hypothetical protein